MLNVAKLNETSRRRGDYEAFTDEETKLNVNTAYIFYSIGLVHICTNH